MEIKTRQLTKAVRLTAILTDKFKQSRLSVNFISERRRENCAKNSLLPSVLVRGSKNFPTMSHICERLDYLYGAGLYGYNRSRGEMQLTGISMSCLSDKYAFDGISIFKQTLELLCDVLFNPLTDENGVFVKDAVEGEKEKQIRYIKAKINNKNRYAQRRCEEIMCEGENYSVPTDGGEEETAAIEPNALFEHYKKLLSSAPVEIYYTGDLDFETLCDCIYEKFKILDYIPVENAPTKVVRQVEKVKNVHEKLPVSQGRLCIGIRALDMTHKDYPALVLLRTVLGGSGVAKLFMNVREKMSLCYSCYATLEGMKGIMMIYAGIDPENKEKALDAIFEQIESIKRGEVSDFELEAAKSELANTYREIYDSPASLESWFIGRRLSGLDMTPKDFSDSLQAVTLDDVIKSTEYLLTDTVYFLEGTEPATDDDDGEES